MATLGIVSTNQSELLARHSPMILLTAYLGTSCSRETTHQLLWPTGFLCRPHGARWLE